MDVYSLASTHILIPIRQLKFAAESEERYYCKHSDLWALDWETFRFILMAAGMILMLGVVM